MCAFLYFLFNPRKEIAMPRSLNEGLRRHPQANARAGPELSAVAVWCVKKYCKKILISQGRFIFDLLFPLSRFIILLHVSATWANQSFLCSCWTLSSSLSMRMVYLYFSFATVARIFLRSYNEKRKIYSVGWYLCILWNMFKIFRTCLVESITATKEYGVRCDSPLCASLKTGDWN